MKQLTSYVRAVGYLNKLFDLLNERFFDSELIRPTITIQSSPRAFGHFSLRGDTWKSLTGDSFEINISAGTLSRPIELTATTLYHEMVHLFCATHSLKDTSNNYVYHNSTFKREAESHGGAVVEKDPSGRYGWTITKPSEAMLDFILENSLTDILITRNEFTGFSIAGGNSHNNGGLPPTSPKKSSSRKYICPCCGNSVRATKMVNIACMDCDEEMIYKY